jgi:phosphonate transport system substrate-binding protein
LVAPITEDGATGFRSVLYAVDNDVTSLRSLAGKTVLIPGRHSFSGYILPRWQLALDGIDIESSGWKLVDGGSSEKAIADIEINNAAGLFGWDPYYADSKAPKNQAKGTLAMLKAGLGKRARDYQNLWQSSPILYGPHAVRKNLDGKAKEILVNFMVNLKRRNLEAYEAVEPNFSGGYHVVTINQYQSVIDIFRSRNKLKKAKVSSALDQNKKTP